LLKKFAFSSLNSFHTRLSLISINKPSFSPI
jgi:hypothetical protein